MKAPQPPQRIAALTPIGDVLARVDALARPVRPREVAVADAEGRVLAADVTVAAPLPTLPTAITEGWAVRAELLADAGPYTPVMLAPSPAWVAVGAALPAGTDAILAPDAVTIDAKGAAAHAAATPGDGVLAAGADALPQRPLRKAGERLRAVDVAALQMAGIARVGVREPRLRIVSTLPDDSAALLVARATSAMGGQVIFVRALERALSEENADAVVAIGGTGYNGTSVTMLARGGDVAIHGIGLSPGETAAIGSAGARPVLLLPDRIDAALAAFLVVGTRLLARLSGLGTPEPGTMVALKRKIVSTVGMADAILVRRDGDGVEPLAAGHWPIAAMARADGWVLVAPQSEGQAAGSMVEMRALP
jgi:molybdopterin molybdotransferase